MKNYKLHPKVTYKELNQFGFTYDGVDNKISIPVYYYKSKKKVPQIFMLIIINLEDDFLTYKIVNRHGDSYSSYYNREYGCNEVIKSIDKKVENILNKLINEKIITKERGEKNELSNTAL